MALPRPVRRRTAASLLLGIVVALAACSELLVDAAAPQIQLALSLAASAAAGGSADAFDKADAISVRITDGETVVYDDVLPFASDGGDVTLAIPVSTDAAGSQLTVQVELLQGQAQLFVGAGTITPEAGGSNTADVTLTPVAAAVLITPASFTFDAIAATTTFRAVAVFATGDTIDGGAPTFRSLAPGIVQIATGGAATAVGPGTTRVEAAYGSTAAQADAAVQQVVTSIEVNQPQTAVAAGATYVFEPTLRDRNGYAVAGRSVAWTSSNPNILRIDANGVATAVGTGTVTVTGTADQATTQFQVRVADPVPAAPSGLTVIVQGTTAILAWQDNSSNETRFDVGVRSAPSAPFAFVATAGPNATGTSNNTNQPDTRLEYVVRACNDAGCSPNSNVVVAVTIPSMPELLEIVFDSASYGYFVRWIDTSTWEDYFHVELSFGGNAQVVDVPKDATEVLSQSYPYGGAWIYACNAAGCSDPAYFVGCGGDCPDEAPALLPVEPQAIEQQ